MRDLPVVGSEFAGYRLIAVLGRGGMSTVFQAENPRLGNMVALKVIAPELADDDIFRTRFLEESRIAAGLNHPNVIPIHDSGSSDGLLYIVMRNVMGRDLRQILKKRGRLPPGMAVFLLGQAARALDAAHRRGLVHRDVKPGNLLVERASDVGDPDHVYLTDFGITKHAAEHSGLTATGQFLGTVDYIAPEQVRGLPADGRADQYSLGCVLYECLTGRVPFERELDAAIIWAHVEERPPPATLLCPDLPPAIDAVFGRVLAKSPGDRYGSCREFMAAAYVALGSSGGPRVADPLPADYQRATPFPAHAAVPQLPPGYPAEVAHELAGVRDNEAGSRQELADWGRSDQGDQRGWPADGVRGRHDGTTVGRPGGSPPNAPSGRRRQGGAPRGGPGRGDGHVVRWVALYAAVVVALAAGIVALVKVTSGGTSTIALSGDGTSTRASVSPSPSPTPSGTRSANLGPKIGDGTAGPTTLAGILAAANKSVNGHGLLPPGKCDNYQQNADGAIVCTAPVAGVAEIFYQNYSSPAALYDAYKAEITDLDGGRAFRQNTGACSDKAAVSYAEFGWNQEEGHPHNFTVAQMAAGQVNQLYASGRMACFETHTAHGISEDIVWTIDGGPALGVAIGSGAPSAVYHLWADLHHAVLFPGTEMCGSNPLMNVHDIPAGNLKIVPVCPPGVQGIGTSPTT